VPDVPVPSAQDLVNASVALGSGSALLSLDNAVKLQQAALPGSVRCTVIGGRAGVPFACRPHLIVQDLPAQAGAPMPSYNSGAVPVQHRTPRPVPLPPNHLATPSPETARKYRQDVALDTWGSWFDLGNPADPAPAAELRTLVAAAVPCDDSFFAPAAGPIGIAVAWVNDPNAPDLPPGLPSTAVSITIRLTTGGSGSLEGWTMSTVLVLSAGQFDLDARGLHPGDTQIQLALPPSAQDALGQLPHGDPVELAISLSPPFDPKTIQGYRQTLHLASLVRRPDGHRLPLQPVYALFEDPDYSRSLTTPTARGARTLRNATTNTGVLVQLAADRREYNPATPIFLTFFTDQIDADEAKTVGRLTLTRRFGRNVSEPLSIVGPLASAPAGQIDVSAGFDLLLLPVQPTAAALPTTGKSVIILAELQSMPKNVLHCRIFDRAGTKMDFDFTPTNYPMQQAAIDALDAQYNQLLLALPVSADNKRSVITAIAAIIDVLWIEGQQPSTKPSQTDVWISAGWIYRLHLEGAIEPGDTLELQLDRVTVGSITLDGDPIVVDLTITDQPVTLPPQSGYGLLRYNVATTAVSCARFAWSPEASRIDLLNPDDLRTEVVRRRAVFRWKEVVRPPAANWTYAVQKLTAGGSTRADLAKFETIAL
jgi:hypothetical protein